MKDTLDRQCSDSEDKKRRIESGSEPLTLEKNMVSIFPFFTSSLLTVSRSRPSLPPVENSIMRGWAGLWPCYSTLVVVHFTIFPLPCTTHSLLFRSLAGIYCCLCFPLVSILHSGTFSTFVWTGIRAWLLSQPTATFSTLIFCHILVFDGVKCLD